MKHITKKNTINCSMFHVPCSRKKGYTLIEILVATAIFFTILAVPSGYFINSLKGQITALASQQLLDQTSYVLEYVSRALRMAKKDTTGNCITAKLNYEKTRSGQGIKFKNYNGNCQEFFLQNNQLQEYKKNLATGEELTLPLTSADLEIISFKIEGEESWSQNNDEQPQITLFLDVKGGKGFGEELRPKIEIQTTISQRNLDVVY